ncbi:uncharacterized protein MONOS_830 [Monocercomonoides exilis]|uniref:uncharacterized protein n=1 Tax=Monocercomonoides exilis TaxID=2049356 RepID=UPI00355A9782|nr:hypothetical protein MONOS_830 [Monocercomonoides exilis]|eukprot:MONOS_830.1-p1 / transcript=MONOS_830.1 / gene=MONOS_830 / organism=Monocercomonoides_exilis_PA203 / gene_product=unspecified product / transcript_product=unspecified product / location=Mono_scaffold00013:252899-253416(+) / protein_length=120 / sequence_SO=supercontig / SO=protein_coding / is_pseudo=false
MVVQEFLNVVSEEWEVIEEEWKVRNGVDEHDIFVDVDRGADVSDRIDRAAKWQCEKDIKQFTEQRARAQGGVKAEGRMQVAEWRDRGYMSQDAEKEVLLEFLEKKNLQKAEVDLLMILW